MPTDSTFARHRAELVTKENLLELARFSDENAHAVSFYFSLASTPNNSHREEAIAIKRLVQQAQENLAPQTAPAALAKDLVDILTVAEEIRLNPARLRAVFACRAKQVWREFDLPAPRSVSHLELGRRFHLLPLMAALQSCVPYCVVTLESGKARAFVVRGTEIHEFPERLKSEDLSLHAEDSRVGWSRHIDRSVGEHEKAYFKNLIHPLHEFMVEQGTRHLIFGCREDLWGEVGPQFAVFQKGVLTGHFHLPNFAVAPSEVLRMASPAFQEAERQHGADLLTEINENPSRAAIGVSDVLRTLSEGRVQTLVLSKLPTQTISECGRCGRMWAEAGRNCVCGSAEAFYMAAEEGLLRQALMTEAEILVVEADALPGFSGAAALLRY